MKDVKDIAALKTISVEELKNFDGFSNTSDAEAQQIVDALKELSLLTHNILMNHERTSSISKFRQTK